MSWGTPTATPEQLRDLFVHRGDTFAVQRETGAYYPVHEPLEDDTLRAHLAGTTTLGLYQLATDNTVKWACWDLDTESSEAREHLVSCVEGFLHDTYIGRSDYANALLLEDSNGQGRTHVWLFLSEPLPAAQARAWSVDFWKLWDAVPTGQWPLEFFPKQDALTDGGYGNLVRLPLGINRKNGKKSRFVGHQGWADSVGTVRKLDSSLVPRYEGRASTLLPGRSQGSRAVSGDSATARLLRGDAQMGVRHKTFVDAAWAMRKRGWDEDLVLVQLSRWNEQLPDPQDITDIELAVSTAYDKDTDLEPDTFKAPRTKEDRSFLR